MLGKKYVQSQDYELLQTSKNDVPNSEVIPNTNVDNKTVGGCVIKNTLPKKKNKKNTKNNNTKKRK